MAKSGTHAKSMSRILLWPIFVLLLTMPGSGTPSQTAQTNLFNDAPAHEADRLYSCLFIRRAADGSEFGLEALDPLFWRSTQYLITGESHPQALACLDRFLKARVQEDLSPRERAILQRDLWYLFDWSTQDTDFAPQRQELQLKLAAVLRQLAMSEERVRKLPDNYAAALASGRYPRQFDPQQPARSFLPPDLFQPTGPWVCIAAKPAAPTHLREFFGQSRFLVFINLPNGRAETFDYLHRLYTSGEPARQVMEPPPSDAQFPQFPAGTKVALVRQMTLFDRDGRLIPTPITESVQIRVYRSVAAMPTAGNSADDSSNRAQEVFDFRLDKQKFMVGEDSGLVAASPEDKAFSPFFRSHGVDPFEGPERGNQGLGESTLVLGSCRVCHSGRGIYSVQSRNRLLPPNALQRDPENGRPEYGARYWETESSLQWKRERYDWGLLNGFWQAAEAASHPARR